MNGNSQKRRDFILKLASTLGAVGTGVISPAAYAKGRSARIKSLTMEKGANQQNLVFELDKSIRHSVFTLNSPDRIVLDLKDTQANQLLKMAQADKTSKQNNIIKQIRQSPRNKTDLRVVLDLEQQAKVSARLKKGKNGYLLEVALKPKSVSPSNHTVKNTQQPKTAVGRRANKKPMIIAIDAGHGGKDPGAIGKKGTKEKDVVLNVAKKLKAYIQKQPGMKAVMIRDGDYYVSLRKRISTARSKKADLFISIHADANPNSSLTGSSVYILSENGASSEAARWLANSENSYESRLAGAHLNRSNKAVSSMLLDLSMSNTIDKSLDLANGVLKQLGSINNLLRNRVESAGFVVLKSPDIPSLLVETAFISNPREEKRLKTSHYQERLAKAIFNGLTEYKIALDESGDRFV